MRVLFVIGQPHMIGGTEWQLLKLAGLLTESGNPTSVHVMAGRGLLTDELDAAGVAWSAPQPSPTIDLIRRQRRVKGPGLASVLTQQLVQRTLAKQVKEMRPAVVHAFLPGCIADGLPIAQAAHPAAVRIAGIRGATPAPVAAPRGMRRRRPLDERMRSAIQRADSVVVNSPHLVETEALRLGAQRRNVVVIPNGVTIPQWQSDPAAEPPSAVVIANFHHYKGHDTLVESLALMPEKLPVRLCGVGANVAGLLDRAKRLGVADLLTVVPPPADVPAELRRAQIGVHPSRTEGLSNAILEEMAAGLPLACTDVGGARLQVADGSNGFLVPADDPPALAAALSRLAGDADLRRTMGERSRQKIADFSWEACTQAHLELYTKLVAARHG